MASSRERSRAITLTEALEEYSAHHPESVEELAQWSARRFERFYYLHQRRQVVQALEVQKNQMVAALWSNSNWDDDKGTRKDAIDELSEQHEKALRVIYGSEQPARAQSPDVPQDHPPEEVEIDKSNPFFGAVDRGMAKLDVKLGHVTDRDRKRDEEHLK